MSHFTQIKTQFKNLNCLVEALRYFGFEPEIHQAPQNLYGFKGDRRKQKAEVVVKRDQISASANDLGFAWNQNSQTYEILISEWDQRSGQSRRGSGLGCEFLGNLKREYAKQIITSQASQLGDEYTVVENVINGQLAGYTIIVEKTPQLAIGQSSVTSNQLFVGGSY
jgi:Protein of unknown function (DUF1257)